MAAEKNYIETELSKMPRKCTICHHPKRDQIDLFLLQNVPYREITGQFGVKKSALSRHKQHLQCKLTPAQSFHLHSLSALESHVQQMYLMALEKEDFRLARALLTDLIRLHRSLYLVWRQPPEAHPFEEIRAEFGSIIGTALCPFPEAKKAVSRALNLRLAQLNV